MKIFRESYSFEVLVSKYNSSRTPLISVFAKESRSALFLKDFLLPVNPMVISLPAVKAVTCSSEKEY